MAHSLIVAFALTGVLSMASEISPDFVIGTFMERQGINDPAFAKYANLMRASFKLFEECFGNQTVAHLYREVQDAVNYCKHREPLVIPEISDPTPKPDAEPEEPVPVEDKDPVREEEVREPVTARPTEAPKTPPAQELGRSGSIQQAAETDNELNFEAFYHSQPVWAMPYPYFNFNPIPQPLFFAAPVLPALPVWHAPPQMRFHKKREASLSAGTSSLVEKIRQLAKQMYNKVSNLTCIIEELGFIGEDRLPNYEAIKDRVSFLPVSDEMVADLIDGVDICRKLTSCSDPPLNIPNIPTARELAKSILFFKCFETQKMAACIKQDLRQRYEGIDDDDGGDAYISGRSGGSAPAAKPIEGEVDPNSLFSMMFGFDIVSLAGSEMLLAL